MVLQGSGLGNYCRHLARRVSGATLGFRSLRILAPTSLPPSPRCLPWRVSAYWATAVPDWRPWQWEINRTTEAHFHCTVSLTSWSRDVNDPLRALAIVRESLAGKRRSLG